MNTVYDRRYLAFLGFLFFLGFLSFLGTQEYRNLAALAAPASLASFASLVFIARSPEKVPEQYRLNSHQEILRALAGRS